MKDTMFVEPVMQYSKTPIDAFIFILDVSSNIRIYFDRFYDAHFVFECYRQATFGRV